MYVIPKMLSKLLANAGVYGCTNSRRSKYARSVMKTFHAVGPGGYCPPRHRVPL